MGLTRLHENYQHCCDIIQFNGDVISSIYLSNDCMPVAYLTYKPHIALWGLSKWQCGSGQIIRKWADGCCTMDFMSWSCSCPPIVCYMLIVNYCIFLYTCHLWLHVQGPSAGAWTCDFTDCHMPITFDLSTLSPSAVIGKVYLMKMCFVCLLSFVLL